MPRLRGSWVAALAGVFWCATTLADTITVTTTDPTLWNVNDSQCSLYEAVEYFNQEKPADGFQGCKKPKDDTSSDTIELPATESGAVLALQDTLATPGGTLTIQGTLTINGRGFNLNSTHTTLQAATNGSVFRTTKHWVCPSTAVKKPATVTSPTQPFVCESTTTTDAVADASAPDGWKCADYRATRKQAPTGSLTPYVCELTASSTITNAVADSTAPNGWKCSNPDAIRQEAPAGHETPYVCELITYATPVTAALTLNQARIDGCGTTATACTINGAAIRVEEGSLAIDRVVFFDGITSGLGGAVYVADGASATFASAIFRNNQAADGAAIYAANMRLTLRQSSLYDNQVSGPTGAIVRVAAGATTAVAGSIENVTFSRNPAGTALRLGSSHIVNHLTIVRNNTGAGAIAGLPGALVIDNGSLTLQNSIVAENGAVECGGGGTSTWIRKFVLFAASGNCQTLPLTGGQTDEGVQVVAFGTVGNPLLLAEEAVTSPTRFNATLTALVDPADNGFLFHRPLFALQPWASLAGSGYRAYSHVIDRGNTSTGTGGCANTDQRGDARADCDLGAIEFKFSANKTMELTEHPAADTVLAGQKIYQGETVVISLADAIGDAELMPDCNIDASLDGSSDVTSTYPNVAGCPVLAAAPTKGTISFNTDGNLVYTPSGSGFHGADTFVLRIYTTSSRFQDEKRYIEVTYTVRADTRGGWQNSSLGGTVSWHWLLLGVLAFWRKKKN